jgi:hypothetical protein
MSLLVAEIPENRRVADVCPHHRLGSSFELKYHAIILPYWGELPTGANLDTGQLRDELRVYRCLFCEQSVLVHAAFRPGDSEAASTEARVLYPDVARPRMAPEAPRLVADLWEEAAVCLLNGAPRGAAACLRGAVEQIAKGHGAVGKDLREKITDLGSKMSLEPDLVDGLHDTRLTGNWSVHDGVAFSDDEISDLSELVKDAVEILYVQPAKRKAMAAARITRRGGKRV